LKAFADDAQHAFPGQGQMKPGRLEIARLKREVAKLKAEREILKQAAAYFANPHATGFLRLENPHPRRDKLPKCVLYVLLNCRRTATWYYP
jgi:hypothetical protein